MPRRFAVLWEGCDGASMHAARRHQTVSRPSGASGTLRPSAMVRITERTSMTKGRPWFSRRWQGTPIFSSSAVPS